MFRRGIRWSLALCISPLQPRQWEREISGGRAAQLRCRRRSGELVQGPRAKYCRPCACGARNDIIDITYITIITPCLRASENYGGEGMGTSRSDLYTLYVSTYIYIYVLIILYTNCNSYDDVRETHKVYRSSPSSCDSNNSNNNNTRRCRRRRRYNIFYLYIYI